MKIAAPKALSFLLAYVLATAMLAQSPLERRIDFDVKQASLITALEKLIDQGVPLNFSAGIIPADLQVTYSGHGVTVREVLDALLVNTSLGYKLVGEQVVLTQGSGSGRSPQRSVAGYVIDEQSGERIPGATVYDPVRSKGTSTNAFGFFNLYLPGEPTLLVASFLGYRSDTIYLDAGFTDALLEFRLPPAYLAEVIVKENPDSLLLQRSGVYDLLLNVSQVSRLPQLGGEPDLFRIGYALPGIQTGADGFGGISVRGGGVDHNLFLFDGVPIYSATHGLGIASIFNTAAVKPIRLLKGSFPAQYGGRLASVWEVQSRDGNHNHLQGEADIGLTTATLTVEGPTHRQRGSWLVSGRRALFDFYSKPISRFIREKDGVDGFVSYLFHDLNVKINHAIGKRNRIFASVYSGDDRYQDVYEQNRYFADTLVSLGDREKVIWGNRVASLRWGHRLGSRAFLNATAFYSRYAYRSTYLVDLKVTSPPDDLLRNVLLLKYDSEVRDIGGRIGMDFTTRGFHQVKAGIGWVQHKFQPGIVFYDNAIRIDSILIDTLGQWDKEPLSTIEWSLFCSDLFEPTRRWQIEAGLRLGALHSLGRSMIEPEPRLSVRWLWKKGVHLNLTAGRMVQFLHLLSPTSVGLPKDLWVSATPKVPPQKSWQISLGASWKLNPHWQLDVEAYQKWFLGLISFKGTFLESVNARNWQDDVSIGKGHSKGLEILLTRQGGRLSGWLAYTWARTNRQFDKEINRGDPFPFRLDRRHSFDLQAVYSIDSKWEMSMGFKFATGSAFTLPMLEYELVQPPGSPPIDIIKNPRVVDQLNGERLPVYHKLDINFSRTFRGHNVQHRLRFGASNVYNRKNPLYVTIRDRFLPDGTVKRDFVSVSLLPFFPTLYYSLRFY